MFLKLDKIVVNTQLIEAFDVERLWFSNSTHEVFLTIEDYQLLLSTLLPEKTKVKDVSPKSDLLELFEELHKLTGGTGKPAFTLGREKKLKELLTKHRMSKEDVIRAATNIGKDAFLQGENESKKRYGDIDYLLRPDKAAKWSEEIVQKKKGMF